MSVVKTLTLPEQVAAHLRTEIRRRRWEEHMPGRDLLAKELEVSPRTVRGALKILEKEGLLIPQGAGHRCRIAPAESREPANLRIPILCYEREDRMTGYLVDIRHRLLMAGHTVEFARKTLIDFRMDVKRLERFVSQVPADAWLVLAGSLEVLKWFSEQPLPVFALFGRYRSLPIAATGIGKAATVAEITRRLVELGHRRIVMLVREDRRIPKPGVLEQTFLNELEDLGIKTGDYNLPHWHDSPTGFAKVLDTLFSHTPPTALFLGEPALLFAAQNHLARRGIHAPEDVSLISLDSTCDFAFHTPSIARLDWDTSVPVRHVMRWAGNITRGKNDRRQHTIKAEFIEGGTIGPAPKR